MGPTHPGSSFRTADSTPSWSSFDLDCIRRSDYVRSVVFEPVLPSTNDLALEIASAPSLELPLLVLTCHQTRGRGRGRRCWWSAPGALTFSWVVDPEAYDLRRGLWPQVALTAALAVLETVLRLVPGAPVGLRWPNDVHLGGKKICGILVEHAKSQGSGIRDQGSGIRTHRSSCVSGAPDRRFVSARPDPSSVHSISSSRSSTRSIAHTPARLVIGIGVNLNRSLREAPDEIRRVGTSLYDWSGKRYDLTATLLEIVEGLSQRLGWLAHEDPRLPDAWQRHCLLRGRTVTLDAGPRVRTGRCLGIDRRGALRVETDEGVETFYGGVMRVRMGGVEF